MSVLVIMRRGIRFTEHNGVKKRTDLGDPVCMSCAANGEPVVLGGSTKVEDLTVRPNQELRPAAGRVSNNQP